jgi:CRP/FNR family cyclic AMP-dependent transcriptional regulator
MFSARQAGMASARPAGTNLLSDLPSRLAAPLLAGATARSLAADEVLFMAGDPGDGLYRVDLAIIDGLPRSATVTALRDCKLRFLSRAAFEKFAAAEPAIYKYLLNVMAARLRDTDQIVAAGSFLPLKGRVARALLDLAHAFGNDVGAGRVVIRQKLSQTDLAAMAGIARENVSRIMNEWIRGKVVTRLSGYYCLEDPKKLQREIDV